MAVQYSGFTFPVCLVSNQTTVSYCCSNTCRRTGESGRAIWSYLMCFVSGNKQVAPCHNGTAWGPRGLKGILPKWIRPSALPWQRSGRRWDIRDSLPTLFSNRVSNLPQGFNIHCLNGWSGCSQCNNWWAEWEQKKKKKTEKDLWSSRAAIFPEGW